MHWVVVKMERPCDTPLRDCRCNESKPINRWKLFNIESRSLSNLWGAYLKINSSLRSVRDPFTTFVSTTRNQSTQTSVINYRYSMQHSDWGQMFLKGKKSVPTPHSHPRTTSLIRFPLLPNLDSKGNETKTKNEILIRNLSRLMGQWEQKNAIFPYSFPLSFLRKRCSLVFDLPTSKNFKMVAHHPLVLFLCRVDGT